MLAHLEAWLTERGYSSVKQLRGSLSTANSPDPSAFERANYTKAILSYTNP